MKNPSALPYIFFFLLAVLILIGGIVFYLFFDVRVNEDVQLRQQIKIQPRPATTVEPTNIKSRTQESQNKFC